MVCIKIQKGRNMRKVYICKECYKPIKEVNNTTLGYYVPGYDGVEIVGRLIALINLCISVQTVMVKNDLIGSFFLANH